VMDFTMGSGGCGVSAKLTGRNFIGIEMTQKYFEIAQTRIGQAGENIVTPDHKQLSTQLPDDVQTVPDDKYEQGILENIRDPAAVAKPKKAKPKKKAEVSLDPKLFDTSSE